MEDIVVTPKVPESSGSVGVNSEVPTQLQSFFNIDSPTSEQSGQLKAIWDFFDGKSEVERLYQVKQLENRLGMPPLGQSRFSKIYEYVKLSNQIDAMEKLRNEL